MVKRGKGWHGEPHRHSLAARGMTRLGAQTVYRYKGHGGVLGPPSVRVFPPVEEKWHLELNRVKTPQPLLSLPMESREIALDGLRSGQTGTFVDQLEPLIRAEGADLDRSNYEDPIIVVKWRGEKVIFEGNHRLAAMKLLGKQKAWVDFLDLDRFIKEHR